MTAILILDSDILIDVAHNVSAAIQRIAQEEMKCTLAISAITEMELMIGCQNQIEQRRTERFLSRFRVLDLNEAISNRAVELIRQYRLSNGLSIPDCLIAATAIVHGCGLLTKNRRHFRFIDNLQLMPY